MRSSQSHHSSHGEAAGSQRTSTRCPSPWQSAASGLRQPQRISPGSRAPLLDGAAQLPLDQDERPDVGGERITVGPSLQARTHADPYDPHEAGSGQRRNSVRAHWTVNLDNIRSSYSTSKCVTGFQLLYLNRILILLVCTMSLWAARGAAGTLRCKHGIGELTEKLTSAHLSH